MIAVLLILGTMGLVFAKIITFNEFLGSATTLIAITAALYQWFIKKEVVKENTELKRTVEGLNRTIKRSRE